MKKFSFILIFLILTLMVVSAQQSIGKPTQIRAVAKDDLFSDVSGKELEMSDMISIEGSHYLRSGYVGSSNYASVRIYGLRAYRLHQLRMKRKLNTVSRKTRELADIASDWIPGVRTVKKVYTTGKKVYHFIRKGWR